MVEQEVDGGEVVVAEDRVVQRGLPQCLVVRRDAALEEPLEPS
jgi:hypothetical protein